MEFSSTPQYVLTGDEKLRIICIAMQEDDLTRLARPVIYYLTSEGRVGSMGLQGARIQLFEEVIVLTGSTMEGGLSGDVQSIY